MEIGESRVDIFFDVTNVFPRHLDIKTTMKYYVEADLDNMQIKSVKPGTEV